MSYDYSLFRAPAAGPMDSWPAGEPPTFGSLADVTRRLGDLFPGLAWERFESTWFGRWQDGERYAEFQVTPGTDDEVRFVTMRRTDRASVELVCHQLGIVAVDPQRMELYVPDTRLWTGAR